MSSAIDSTDSGPPPPFDLRTVAAVSRAREDLDERARQWRAAARAMLAWRPRLQVVQLPRRLLRAIGALALLALAVHLLALAALHDLSLQARQAITDRVSADPYLAADGIELVRWDAQRARVAAGGNDSVSVRGHAHRIVGAELFVDGALNTLATTDRGGGLRATMIGWQEDGAPFLSALYAAGTRWLWLPVGRPMARAALRLALVVETLNLPEVARVRATGRWQDCSGCPPMVEIRPGWAIAGDRALPRLIAPRPPYLVALKAVDRAQWLACRNAGACLTTGEAGADRDPDEVARLVGWAGSASGRAYRIATTEERLVAAAAQQAAGIGGADLATATGLRLASDDTTLVRLAPSRDDFRYGGDPGKTDLLLVPCATGAAARAAATRLAAALARTGHWGSIDFRNTPPTVFAAIEGVQITYDAGHPETAEIARLRTDLAAAGVPPAMAQQVVNPSERTPWYLSLVVCPPPSSGSTGGGW